MLCMRTLSKKMMFSLSFDSKRTACEQKSIVLRNFFTYAFLKKIALNTFPYRLNSYTLICLRLMAGHAKWQNVKHIKAEKDRQKNITCNKFAHLISMAVKESGRDLKANHKLAILVDQAKKSNVPMSTIENAIKKDNKKTKFGSVEILGPGGCMLVVEYVTDNVSTIRHELKTVCKKNGANIMTGEGRWRAVYEQKGIIKVISYKDGQILDPEKALDAAIEAGAEEVLTREDEDQKIYFEFLGSADDLNMMKKELEKQFEIEDSFIGYIPTVTVALQKQDAALMDTLLEDLGSLSDVVRIYENAQ